jgi:hypothetical protein
MAFRARLPVASRQPNHRISGDPMEQAQAAAKVMTELTCWKCGEESLKEAAGAGATRGAHGELLASTSLKHSDCQKCGALSVNPAQAKHNKMVGRKARKELIRESNRTSA